MEVIDRILTTNANKRLVHREDLYFSVERERTQRDPREAGRFLPRYSTKLHLHPRVAPFWPVYESHRSKKGRDKVQRG